MNFLRIFTKFQHIRYQVFLFHHVCSSGILFVCGILCSSFRRHLKNANHFGLHSVLIDWSDRRPYDEELPEDHAEYRIHRPEELLPLAEKLERELS